MTLKERKRHTEWFLDFAGRCCAADEAACGCGLNARQREISAGLPLERARAAHRASGSGELDFRPDVVKKVGARSILAAQDFENMSLKVEHTFYVLDNALELARAVPDAFPDMERVCFLAALYHDIGRFPQYMRYATFQDAQSVNHGFLGSKIMGGPGPLREETPFVRGLARAAVCLHNKFTLPRALPPALSLVTGILRDADKLDIFRVVSAYTRPGGKRNSVVTKNLEDEPMRWTPGFVDAVLSRRPANARSARYLNDFCLLLCSWIPTFNIPHSRTILLQSGLVRTILADLPDAPEMDAVRRTVEAALQW